MLCAGPHGLSFNNGRAGGLRCPQLKRDPLGSYELLTMTSAPLSCILLLSAASAAAQHGKFPWKAGDSPPAVAGVPLAASRARLDSLLGAPTDSQRIGADGWAFNFRTKGVSVVYTPLNGAAIIYLLRRDVGDIGGVRLGDSKGAVLGRWGAPSTSDGPNALYIAGKWVVVITLDSAATRVVKLGLGRVGDSDQ